MLLYAKLPAVNILKKDQSVTLNSGTFSRCCTDVTRMIIPFVDASQKRKPACWFPDPA